MPVVSLPCSGWKKIMCICIISMSSMDLVHGLDEKRLCIYVLHLCIYLYNLNHCNIQKYKHWTHVWLQWSYFLNLPMQHSIGNFKNNMNTFQTDTCMCIYIYVYIHTHIANTHVCIYTHVRILEIHVWHMVHIYIYMCMCGVAISYQARLILLRPKSFVTICAIA